MTQRRKRNRKSGLDDPSPSVYVNGLDGEINETDEINDGVNDSEIDGDEDDEIDPELRGAIEKAIDHSYAAIKCLQQVLDGDSAKRHRRVVARTWSRLQ